VRVGGFLPALSDLPAWVWLVPCGVAEVGAFRWKYASGAGKKGELGKREVGRL